MIQRRRYYSFVLLYVLLFSIFLTLSFVMKNAAVRPLWDDRPMATATCPVTNSNPRTVFQSTILNPPFVIIKRDLWSGLVIQENPSIVNTDTIPGTTNQGVNLGSVFLSYGSTDDEIPMSVFHPKPLNNNNNPVDQNNNDAWEFVCPWKECQSAQNNVLMQDANRNTTLFVYSFDTSDDDDDNNDTDSSSNYVTCLQIIMNNSTLVDTTTCFPSSYQAWMQVVTDSFAFFLLRGLLNNTSDNDDDKNDVRLYEVRLETHATTTEDEIPKKSKSLPIQMVDRLPEDTKMLCASDEWVLVGFHIVEVWRRETPTSNLKWIQTLLPPNDVYYYYSSSCTIRDNNFAAIAWYKSYGYESQTIVDLYDLQNSIGNKIPSPIWRSSSQLHDHILHLDQIQILSFLPPPPSSFSSSSNNSTSVFLLASHDGEVAITTDTQQTSSHIAIYELDFLLQRNQTWTVTTRQEMSVMTAGSVTFGTVTIDRNEMIGVYCGKLCHAEEACAGGQTIAFTFS